MFRVLVEDKAGWNEVDMHDENTFDNLSAAKDYLARNLNDDFNNGCLSDFRYTLQENSDWVDIPFDVEMMVT